MTTTLQELKDYYKSVFFIEDDFIIDLVLAIALGIHTNSDPVWLMIVGGSSSGKSEIIQMLDFVKYVHPVSNMTENTFLSGSPSSNGKETSLLKEMGPKGIITMKDYTSILAMRSEKKEVITSQMREIFDGHIVKKTGNGLNPEWKGKMNFIGGVTDAIYSADGESAAMGRRAVIYSMPQQDRKKTLNRSRQNTNDGEEKRNKIKQLAHDYMEEMIPVMPLTLPPIDEELSQELMELANFSTHARSPTERDYKGMLNLVHDAEMPMRVSQQLHLLAQILIHMNDGKLTDTCKYGLYKIAFDNIPKLRRKSLNILAQYRRVTAKGLAQTTNYPTETAKRWLEDLNVLGILTRGLDQRSKMDMFQLQKEYRSLILKYNKIEYIDDDLIGNEETADYSYGGDAYSMDIEIAKAEQLKSKQEFLEF